MDGTAPVSIVHTADTRCTYKHASYSEILTPEYANPSHTTEMRSVCCLHRIPAARACVSSTVLMSPGIDWRDDCVNSP